MNEITARKLVLSAITAEHAKQMGAMRKTDQRIGQAFMNSAPSEWYSKLTGTLQDPFHRDTWVSVFNALVFLGIIE